MALLLLRGHAIRCRKADRDSGSFHITYWGILLNKCLESEAGHLQIQKPFENAALVYKRILNVLVGFSTDL